MGDEESKKRAGVQVHLSTAIVLMFVAGGLVWANVHQRIYVNHPVGFSTPRAESIIFGEYFAWGWPLDCKEIHYQWEGNGGIPNLVKTVQLAQTTYWDLKLLIIDTIIALAILAAVGFALEWRVRRKKGN